MHIRQGKSTLALLPFLNTKIHQYSSVYQKNQNRNRILRKSKIRISNGSSPKSCSPPSTTKNRFFKRIEQCWTRGIGFEFEGSITCEIPVEQSIWNRSLDSSKYVPPLSPPKMRSVPSFWDEVQECRETAKQLWRGVFHCSWVVSKMSTWRMRFSFSSQPPPTKNISFLDLFCNTKSILEI